ncbi:ABC transporter ATP-binding protein [Roseococcus sp. YIM B11640]|uniref:ABC transporter ATP-binding protein n=1 Tax=Roseococcus sp. YIM B11640 TaxID=3133973 RepID=UPI003C79B88C
MEPPSDTGGLSVDRVALTIGGSAILRGVSLHVAPGEFVALLGPSGCGKTTLMRIIAGIQHADSGTVRIGGRNVSAAHPAERDVAMVFQSYALYPHLTVAENIAVPLAMRRMSAWQRIPLLGGALPGTRAAREAITRDVARVAAPLGLSHLLDRRPGQLSGGQRQRVALARAVIRSPGAFLMDEPLSNLDAALRVTMRREIVEVHRRVGAATLYVTHDQSEALTMADRIAVMQAGEILQVASPEVIYRDPADLRVASFIGSPRINLLEVTAEESGRLLLEGTRTGLSTPLRGPATLGIRPEDWRLDGTGIEARVEHAEFLGDHTLLHLRLGAAPVTMRAAPSLRPVTGEALRLSFDPARALLFGADGKRAALAAREPARA